MRIPCLVAGPDADQREPPSDAVFGGVELTGVEPVTFALPARQLTSLTGSLGVARSAGAKSPINGRSTG
jgi:hypothetical protein